MHPLLQHVCRLTACCFALSAWATPDVHATDWDKLQPVSDVRLAALRGGFDVGLGQGLKLSFGFERVIFINGELVASSRIAINDLANLSAGNVSASNALPPSAVAPLAGSSQIISNGQVISLPNTTAMLTGIQNSLNNQLIQVRTTIDATLASMTQLRTQLFADAFRQSIVDSRR